MRSPQLNRVIIAGNLTSDPKSREVGQNNTTVCNFRIASTKRYKQGDDWKDKTAFVDVVCWKGVAKRTAEKAEKGTAVIIEGELQLSTWEKDGQTHSRLEVLAHSVSILEAGGQSRKDQPEPDRDDEPDYSDDIPF